jgi:hypothetical protein
MLKYMIIGGVQNYTVLMADDCIEVTGNGITRYEKVPGLGGFLSRAKDIRFGWGRLPDSEVIYIYDKGDDNFGYALNITDGQLSEWGYAPFPVEQKV